jgi:hypothetical protein
MSEASRCIADLDRELTRLGDTVQLQRLIADPDTGNRTVSFSADFRARVDAHHPQELVPMSGEAPNTRVILSPTGLRKANWPGLPQKDDRLVIGGKNNNIEIVSPLSIGDVIVRIELECRGDFNL